MRARTLFTLLPEVKFVAKGSRSWIKISLTTVSSVSLESWSSIETTTLASSVALRESRIWARKPGDAVLANIEGEVLGLGRSNLGGMVFSGFLLSENFLGKLIAIEVLYGLCGVGQNLDDTVVDTNFYVVHNVV